MSLMPHHKRAVTYESSHVPCFVLHAHEISQHPAHQVLSEDDNLLVEVLYARRITCERRFWQLVPDILGEGFWNRGTRQSRR
jgi:hypothetical protein